jgi:hypothetical protein
MRVTPSWSASNQSRFEVIADESAHPVGPQQAAKK